MAAHNNHQEELHHHTHESFPHEHNGEWIINEEDKLNQRYIQNEFLELSRLQSNQMKSEQLKYDAERDNFNTNMPFKHNHIELEGGHKINASRITSPLDGESFDFIATQAPKKNHLGAYWKMIWTF